MADGPRTSARRRLGKVASVAALCVIVAVTFSASGDAYRFHAYLWPGGIVRYYNAAPDQAWAVRRAVGAWNTSGAHIRFVAVPRASAQMVIEENPNKIYCAEGQASVGYARGAHVLIFPAHGITHSCNRYWAARVMAHELGHVLGLEHEDRYCATMNSSGSMRGGRECERVLWAWRCRLLERDDIAGVAAEYGGAPRPDAEPALCPLYGQIASARIVGAAQDTSSLHLQFRRPETPKIPAFVVPSPWHGHDAFVVSQPRATCTEATAVVPTGPRYVWNVPEGDVQDFTIPALATGSCIAVWALDRLGRPSRPYTVTGS